MFEMLYGLHDGNILSIGDVQQGFSCNCTCPICGDRLVAKQGSERIWHFAHFNRAMNIGCHETLLHKRAKELLMVRKAIMLPPVYWTPFAGCVLFPFTSIIFDTVKIEVRIGNGWADAVVCIGGLHLAIEFYVTHKVSKERIYEYRELHQAAVEIDLVAGKDLDDSIISSLEGVSSGRRWICNRHIESSHSRRLHSLKLRRAYYSY